MQPLRVLTWHVHGSYLYNMVQSRHQFFLPAKPGRPEGYGGRSGHFDWPSNVHEVPADDVRDLDVDCVITQSRKNVEVDYHELLTREQRELPHIHIEHDPPREHPTDTQHFIDDPNILLVHVTAFNRLMWNSGRTPVRVVEHGVAVPKAFRYAGTRPQGFVCVNNISARGRRLGADIFEHVAEQVPLSIAGMGTEAMGGLGDLPRLRLFEVMAEHRFFFNPIRYTSLGLSVCEAMTIGLPVVALATTEIPTVVENGVSGFVDTNIDRLIQHMQALVEDRELAARLGAHAREVALERFSIARFAQSWDGVLAEAVGNRTWSPAQTATIGGEL